MLTSTMPLMCVEWSRVVWQGVAYLWFLGWNSRNLGYGNGGYRGRLFWVAFPGGHGVFYRRVKGGSLGGERRKYLSDDPAQCGRDMMEQCIGGRLGSFFTQAESMDVTAARLSGTRQFTGRGRGQVGQLLHASKTGMLQHSS